MRYQIELSLMLALTHMYILSEQDGKLVRHLFILNQSSVCHPFPELTCSDCPFVGCHATGTMWQSRSFRVTVVL